MAAKVHFGVSLTAEGRYIQERRVLVLDYDHRALMNVRHGMLMKAIPFDNITNVHLSPTNPYLLSIRFSDNRPYQAYLQSPQDREELHYLLREIQYHRPDPRGDMSVIWRRGFLDYNGKHMFVVLALNRMLFSFDSDSQYLWDVQSLHGAVVWSDGRKIYVIAQGFAALLRCGSQEHVCGWLDGFVEAGCDRASFYNDVETDDFVLLTHAVPRRHSRSRSSSAALGRTVARPAVVHFNTNTYLATPTSVLSPAPLPEQQQQQQHQITSCTTTPLPSSYARQERAMSLCADSV